MTSDARSVETSHTIDHRCIDHSLIVDHDAHVLDEVEIDVGRNVHFCLLDIICAVGRDIEMTDKAHRLGYERSESKVDIAIAIVEFQSIEYVELVESRSERRERAHEFVGEDEDIVVGDVDLGEDLGLDSLHYAIGHHILDTSRSESLDNCFLRIWGFTKIMGLNFLLRRDRQHGRTRQRGCVDIVLDEVESLLHGLDAPLVEVVE